MLEDVDTFLVKLCNIHRFQGPKRDNRPPPRLGDNEVHRVKRALFTQRTASALA